jgi:hypothetical protein
VMSRASCRNLPVYLGHDLLPIIRDYQVLAYVQHNHKFAVVECNAV